MNCVKKGFTAAALLLASMASGQADAGAVFSYVSTPLPAGTQTLVSVPVNNAVEVELVTAGVSGSVINLPAASVVDSAYNAGAYPAYYVRFIDGPAAGLWSSVTVNSPSSITIADADVAAQASAGGGDTIRVYKHHTVGSIFPADKLDDADGGSLTTGMVSSGLQIQFFSDGDTINKAQGSGAPSFASFLAFGGFGVWDTPDVPLLPESCFIVSNPTPNDLVYIASGFAPDHAVSYLIKPNVSKDTFLGSGYPVPTTVSGTGLGSGQQNRTIFTRGTGVNQAPGSGGGAIYSYLGFLQIWDEPDAEIQPFGGFILRQEGADAGGVSVADKPY